MEQELQPFALVDVTKAVDAPFPAEQEEQPSEAASSSTDPVATTGKQAKRPATSLTDDLYGFGEKDEKPELKRLAEGTDLEPWSDGFYGLLQAADYPTGDPDDDLMGEEDLPPAARRVPKEIKRLMRDAHRNLGHPSNNSLVRLMSVAKCHPDMVQYAHHMN